MSRNNCNNNNNNNPVIIKDDEFYKDEYVVNIIHDLRSHVNVILSAEQIMEHSIDESKEETKYLEMIKKNPSDWLYDQCVDIMAELMGVVDNKDRIQLSDVRFQMMFGYNGDLDCYIDEYRKIRAELIDELIKLPEGKMN